MSEIKAVLDHYEPKLIEEASYHRKYRLIDAWCYHVGTGLVLLLSAAVTVIEPKHLGDLEWLPRALGGLTVFLVGLDRSFAFGPRWQFQIQMEAEYRGLLDLLRSVEHRPADQHQQAIAEFFRALAAVRGREHHIASAVYRGGQSTSHG